MLTLRTTSGHDERSVVSTEILHTKLADLSSDLGQRSRNFLFEGSILVTTRGVLQKTFLRFVNEPITEVISIFDFAVFAVVQFRPRNHIVDAERETLIRKPTSGEFRQSVHGRGRLLGSIITQDDTEYRLLLAVSDCVLVEDSTHDFTVDDHQISIVR